MESSTLTLNQLTSTYAQFGLYVPFIEALKCLLSNMDSECCSGSSLTEICITVFILNHFLPKLIHFQEELQTSSHGNKLHIVLMMKLFTYNPLQFNLM